MEVIDETAGDRAAASAAGRQPSASAPAAGKKSKSERADQAIRRIELGNLGVMAASGLKRLGLHGAKTVDPSLPGLSGAGTSVVTSGIGMASVEIATTAYARGKEVLQHREASKDFRKAREEYVKQANGLAQAPEGDGDRRMALAQHAAAQLTDKAAALVESKKRMTSAPGVTSRGSGIARDIGLNAAALGPAAAHFTGEPFASVAWPVMSMISGSTQLAQGAADARLADRQQADIARGQMKLEGLALAEGESSAGRLKSAFDGLKAALPQAQHKRLDALHDKLKVGSADRARRYVSTMFHSGRHESPLLNQDRTDFIHLMLEKEVQQAAQGLADRRLEPEQAQAFVDELKGRLTRLKADEAGQAWQKLRMPEGFMAEGQEREQALQSVQHSFQSSSLRQKLKNTLGGRDSNLQEALKRLAIDAKAQDKLDRLESFVDWYAKARDSSLQKDVEQLFHFAGGPLARLNKSNGTAYTRAHQRQNMREQLLWNLASYVHEHQAAGTLDTNAFAQHVRALGDSLKPSMNLGEQKVPNARQRHPLVDLGAAHAASAAGASGHAQASPTATAALDLFKRSIHGTLDAGSAGARRDYQAAGVRMATGAVTLAGGALDTAGLSVAGLPMRIVGPWLAISYAVARGTRREVESRHAGVVQQRHQDELSRVRSDFSVEAGGSPAPQRREDYSKKLLDLAQGGNHLALISMVRDQLRDERQLSAPGPATQLLSELKMSASEIQEFADSDESYLKTQLFGPSATFRYNGDAAALIDKELPRGMPRPRELGR